MGERGETALFHLLCAVGVGWSWATGQTADAVFTALLWAAVVLGCRMLIRAGSFARDNITDAARTIRRSHEEGPDDDRA